MSAWIYDIETYPNLFSLCAVYENGKGMRSFEVSSRKNETQALMEFLRNVYTHGHSLVGFNNVGFDWQVMESIIAQSRTANMVGEEFKISYKEVYEQAMKLIKSQDTERLNLQYREKEFTIPQIDLYKIHHFDNKARATSLKILEFNMRSSTIEDLPFPVGKVLSDAEMDMLIEYNKHDVLKTLEFYNHSKEAIDFRKALTEEYGFDCTNYNDTKIGKEYFISQLERLIPGSCYKVDQFGRRKINQTKREVIHLNECVFDYVSYSHPAFKAVLEWFKKQSISETKGVFTDILEHNLGDVAKYAKMKTKRVKLSDPENKKNNRYIPDDERIAKLKKEFPLGWLEVKELKSPKGANSYYWNYNISENLNVIVDGLQYVFGTGGIHASIESDTVRADDEYILIDADVSSMYPNIAIVNRVYPEHLTVKFCDIYKNVYDTRQGYAKGTPKNAVMKLALNGVYGDSNNQYSPFYDPKYTMTITINGQLSLCMLAEGFMKIEGCTIIQCNTDGVTVKIPRNKREQYDEICKTWQETTKLVLEFADYDAMFIRDVNNYIALYTNGKVKRKGAYEYEGLGWHQNHSALVIPKAAEHEMLGRGSVEEFIRKHNDEYDFMLRTKVPRSSRLVLEYEDGRVVQEQNICRYYPAVMGGKLIKIMPPLPGKEKDGERRLSIDKEWNVKTCNNMVDFDWDIDYNYYISEAKKLVQLLDGENDESE